MRSAILVRTSGAGDLLADCKYKRIEARLYRQHDAYQVLAYCTALRVPVGLLIYPEHLTPVFTTITVRNAFTCIAEISVNLGGELRQLRVACEELAESVVGGATGHRLVALGR